MLLNSVISLDLPGATSKEHNKFNALLDKTPLEKDPDISTTWKLTCDGDAMRVRSMLVRLIKAAAAKAGVEVSGLIQVGNLPHLKFNNKIERLSERLWRHPDLQRRLRTLAYKVAQ
jgi:hypothetical protein